jgi:hypothetical protein
MDLVGRKLMQRGGANVQAFAKDVGSSSPRTRSTPDKAKLIAREDRSPVEIPLAAFATV